VVKFSVDKAALIEDKFGAEVDKVIRVDEYIELVKSLKIPFSTESDMRDRFTVHI